MKYDRVIEGTYLSRPNRFLAHVEIEDVDTVVHVKNTGRCRELLIPGARVYLQESDNPARKTRYDLIAVYKGDTLVNMDSQIPNSVAEEWLRRGNLFPKDSFIRREKTYGNSRFDLYASWEADGVPHEAYMEVKGVTLEVDGEARFPDAPTLRGVKHAHELCECVKDGMDAYILFVIQMKGITSFSPNWVTHQQFGQALKEAQAVGVHLLAYDCLVTPDGIELDRPIPIIL